MQRVTSLFTMDDVNDDSSATKTAVKSTSAPALPAVKDPHATRFTKNRYVYAFGITPENPIHRDNTPPPAKDMAKDNQETNPSIRLKP